MPSYHDRSKGHDSRTVGHPSRDPSNAMKGHRHISRYQVNMTLQYRASLHHRDPTSAFTSLIDRGANGSIAGGNMRVITWLDASVDLSGIDNHTLRNLRMVVAAGVARSNKGNVLLVAHHMAYMPDGRTILSPGQLEHRGCKIEDRSKKVTGKHPYLETPTGFIVPIAIRKGLPYIQLRFPSDKEIDELPRVEITSPQQWDPRILDNDVDETWYDNNSPEDGPPSTDPVNDKGELQEDPFQLDSDPSDHEDRRHHP